MAGSGREKKGGERQGKDGREAEVSGRISHKNPHPSQMSEPKTRRISWPVKTDNMLDISPCLHRRHMFIIYHTPSPESLSPSFFSSHSLLCLFFSVCLDIKSPLLLRQRQKYIQRIFHVLLPTVELGGKWCRRRTELLYFSLKERLERCVCFPRGISCSFGLLRNK